MKLSYRNPIGILVLVILLAGGAFIVARASGAPRCGTITSDAAFGGNGQETFQPSQSAVTSCIMTSIRNCRTGTEVSYIVEGDARLYITSKVEILGRQQGNCYGSITGNNSGHNFSCHVTFTAASHGATAHGCQDLGYVGLPTYPNPTSGI